jgi:1-deoxy-D-xylulose-5-phosphate synthase
MSKILDTIRGPADVKRLSINELEALAQEIRQELLDVLSETGGHLGPNLGVVEVTLAMHYVFESPKDRFIMDVSHQGYVHKLLTGRRQLVKRMRKFGGACGFLYKYESPHDHHGAGHAGTALSVALGMAKGRDMRNTDENIIALFGDAALTCGVSFEALNNISHSTKKFIGILNDNEWSISKNVGAISNYLNKLTTHPTYNMIHKKTGEILRQLHLGQFIKLGKEAEAAVKGLLVGKNADGVDWSQLAASPSILFEEMGLHYFGPIDGHNLKDLIHMLRFAKEAEWPVVLHVLTVKGKGYEPALAKPEPFHGCGAFDLKSGEFKAAKAPDAWNKVFGKLITKLADTNQKLVAITGAMSSGTGLSVFAKTHPNRFFDVGIAEEHAALFAAGLATTGHKPVLTIYSTFLQRAYDMIIHDICLNNLPVMICMDRAGCVDDGPTHHGVFDIAYLNPIPNMIHMQPKDEDEFQDMLFTMSLHDGPSAIRYPRGAGPGVKIKDTPRQLEIGKAEVIRHGEYGEKFKGKRVAIWGLGNMLPMALETAKLLEADGISAAVINPRFIRPLDAGTLEFFGRNVDCIATIEDHVLRGGFNSNVLGEMNRLGLRVPLVSTGWPDEYIEWGSIPELRNKHHITAEATADKIRKALKIKKALPKQAGELATV